MNILILEDESLVAFDLLQTIQSFGYNDVEFVSTKDEFSNIIQKKDFDLLFLDINLGDEDGIKLYQKHYLNIPVIFITAYCDEKTINRAVHTNIIGYLAKPFNIYELQALLKVFENKFYKEDTIVFLNEDYHFDTLKNELYFKKELLILTPNELSLFKLLLEAKGNYVSYDSIEREVWPDKIVSSAACRTLIHRLRTKLTSSLILNKFGYGIALNLNSKL